MKMLVAKLAQMGNFCLAKSDGMWPMSGAMAYRLEGQTLNRENLVSNATAVASNLWQV